MSNLTFKEMLVNFTLLAKIVLNNFSRAIFIDSYGKIFLFGCILVSTFYLFMYSTSLNAFVGKAIEKVIAINPGASHTHSQHPYNETKVTVKAGTNVTWINYDGTTPGHTIISGDPDKVPSNIFYSPRVGYQKSYTFIFTNPGIYQYYDRFYPHMKGQVIVEEDTNETSDRQ
jgi:plastocyanin